MKREHKYMMGGAAAVVAIIATAAGAAYIATDMSDQPTQQVRATNSGAQYARAEPVSQPQPARVECDDNNIVGTIGGGIAGGVIGSQFGSGSGRTVATTAGALGGAALGNKYIPTRGATCD